MAKRGIKERLVAVIDHFGLDFDDAYQYVAAEMYDVELVSFDEDFLARITAGLVSADFRSLRDFGSLPPALVRANEDIDRTDRKDLSLAMAMRGMEAEGTPTYAIADLEVAFS